MKKILFLQTNGNSGGGIWYVNKTVGEELIKRGYDVEILGVRNAFYNDSLEHSEKLKTNIINDTCSWGRTHLSDIKEKLKKGSIFKAITTLFKVLEDKYNIIIDLRKLKKYIIKNNYDYIVVTQYELLDGIPKKFLNKTFYEHHTSLKVSYSHKNTKEKLNKYKNKIKFIWLTKNTYDFAIKNGFKNSVYIYNPVKFITKDKADVYKNKKLVTIARLSEEKRIDLMVQMVNEILKNDNYKEWTLEIYGEGSLKEKIMQMDFNKKKIKFMGTTNDPKKVLLSSSINLNTSLFEGFSMTILEAQECGVPTVSFNFGESVSEQIIQKETGIYVNQDDKEEYKKSLIMLMDNKETLEKMSSNCKENSKNFQISNIIEEWVKLFN